MTELFEPLLPHFIRSRIQVISHMHVCRVALTLRRYLLTPVLFLTLVGATLNVEEAFSQPANQSTSKAVAISAREHTQAIFPSLLQTAEKRGFIRVIVGLESAYQSSSIQNGNDQKIQRRKILDTGRQLIASLQNHTVNIRHQYETIPFMAMNVDAQALAALRNSPLVRSIEEDTLDQVFMASSNPVIGSPLAWAEGYDGNGWAVAVLDTGVETSHSWFTTGGDRIVSEACYSTNEAGISESLCPDGAENSTAENSGLHCDFHSSCSHGTHVAGTVAGNDAAGPNYGVARGADIIAIQVFSKFLTEDDCGIGRVPCLLSADSDQVAAMERVLQLSDSMNIAAVNMSLGGGEYSDQTTCDADNLARKEAIQNLRDIGIATVIAAGNHHSTDSIAAPACISNAISVGATDDVDNVASFSNIYPQLHLLAPGVAINSSVPPNNLASKQGTSMAVPHVAGAWAVMKQRSPLASVTEVLSALTNTATQVEDQRASVAVQTFARINLDLALGELQTSPQPEFESTPEAFSVINFGPVYLGHTSREKTLAFENAGTADLTISCSEIGTESVDFTMNTCTTPISPEKSTEIPLFCTPSSVGEKTVTLHVTTNDANETNLSYRLLCTGVELSTGDKIFGNDFEG